MSLNSKVIMSFLAGTFSAVLAWVVIDFNGVYRIPPGGGSNTFLELFSHQAIIGAIFGSFVGIGIGLVNGLSTGSGKIVQRNVTWGAVVGLAGGLLGIFFGQMLFGTLYKNPSSAATLSVIAPLIFVWDVIVRALGWGLIGLFIGLVQGLPSGSSRAAKHGALGGLIGGLVGGSLFEIVPYVLPPGIEDVGVVSRGISMTVTGASIGFFIGLVEALLKQAWIRVVLGRNEGKEYVISKPRTTIGRDELSDIGLFGDRNISPLHATIEVQNGRHVLHDAGAQIGTSVSGQRMTSHILRDGDLIEIGSMKLEFHEKATASRVPRPVDVPKPPVQIPTTTGICPFCGTKKDPNTGACACSVGGQPGAQQPPVSTMQTPMPSGAGPRLVGVSGPYAGQPFPLSPSQTITVGREPGRDVQLPMDSTVSRKHARIENEGGAFVVYDEGSSNGTAVNGMRVTRQQLAPGDTVEFGNSVFRFEQ
ncbi:MAG: FHA domain-containing protein [Armatimonadetes bacterium]|nr:FHA domain-containing protein [Armatimonadota bacterium]